MPADWAELTVEKQRDDPESTLSFYRRALQLRRERGEFDGGELEWLAADREFLIFERNGGALVCALNAGRLPMALPPGDVILASAPLVDGKLPPDAAAWLV
jgi:alpha-glucosidase